MSTALAASSLFCGVRQLMPVYRWAVLRLCLAVLAQLWARSSHVLGGFWANCDLSFGPITVVVSSQGPTRVVHLQNRTPRKPKQYPSRQGQHSPRVALACEVLCFASELNGSSRNQEIPHKTICTHEMRLQTDHVRQLTRLHGHQREPLIHTDAAAARGLCQALSAHSQQGILPLKVRRCCSCRGHGKDLPPP